MKKEDFKFIKEIGSGGFSYVYKAVDINGILVPKNEKVAIKIMKKNQEFSKVIESEKRIFELLKLHQNKNIIRPMGYFEEGSYILFVMEYIEGIELFNHVSYLDNDDDIKYILRQIISSIKFIHDKNISHGDIKLENFLITKDNRVVLIDFGLSNIGNQASFTRKGTAMYAAPELVFIGKKGYYGKKIDMWALGTVIYILKYKSYPFLGRSLMGIPLNFKNEYEKMCYYDDEVHHPIKFKDNEFRPLINGLICLDQDRRFTIDQVVNLFME